MALNPRAAPLEKSLDGGSNLPPKIYFSKIIMLSAKIKTHLIKLKQKKYRNQFGEFIVEGFKSVATAVKSALTVKFVVVEETFIKKPQIEKLTENCKRNAIAVYIRRQAEGDKIKTTETFPGIMAVVAKPEFGLEDLASDAPIFAFDNIADPGNLGAIIRTADWFGFYNILLSENSVDPYNEKSARATMGSIFSAKIFQSPDIKQTIKILKDKKYKIILLDSSGSDINSLQPENKTVYLFGSEARGVVSRLDKLVDKIYAIKGKGAAESLNIASAAAILMSKI